MIKVLEVNVDDLYTGGVYSLVKNVIEHPHENIQIDIASIEKFQSQKNIDHFESIGTKVYYIGYKGSKWRKQTVIYKNLKKLLTDNHYDFVHIHADVSNKLLVSALAAKKADVKRVVVHSHAAGVDGNHRTFKVVIHRLCRSFLRNTATDYVACSDVAADWMYPNIDKNKVKIIKNGIDLDRFRFNESIRNEIRNQLGVTDEILVGHVGRFAYQKNHEYILKIAEQAKKKDLTCKFLLIGEGPEFERIKSMAVESKLNDVIIFYGISDKINQLFMAMDVFILPSHFEGLPIVGVEAQASGLPVIFSTEITRQAKLTEQAVFIRIDDNDLPKWVEQIDEFGRSKSDREGTYLQLRSEGYSIENTVQEFRSLYLGEIS